MYGLIMITAILAVVFSTAQGGRITLHALAAEACCW